MRRTTSTAAETARPSSDRARFRSLPTRDVMQYGVVSIDMGEPVCKAIQLLLDKHISGLPVTNQGRLAGILSEKDVLKLLYEQEYLPGLVGDYMSRDIVTFDIESPFSDIYDCLTASVYRRVPILHQGRLAGMITRADLIRVYRERLHPPESVPVTPRLRKEFLAQDAMVHGLLTVRKETPLTEVMDILSTRHVTGLPVVDDAMRLEGMITEKDIIRCLGDREACLSTVRDHMTVDVVAFEPTAPLGDVCACLIRRNFRRVPIVRDGRLLGIVARADIIRKMSQVFKLAGANADCN